MKKKNVVKLENFKNEILSNRESFAVQGGAPTRQCKATLQRLCGETCGCSEWLPDTVGDC